jgi:FkbM family methyltransferase
VRSFKLYPDLQSIPNYIIIRYNMKQLIQIFFEVLGYQLSRIEKKNKRSSLEGAIEHVKKKFSPATIVDVGGAFGEVTEFCAQEFPNAKILTFEPLSEYRPALEKIARRNKNIKTFQFAVGSQVGEITFNVHDDLVGSSLFQEVEGAVVDGKPRTVPMITLDKVIKDESVASPYLIKVDVQGAELEVIKGASDVLKDTEVLILEVSLFAVFKSGPQFYDIVLAMKERGFICYDIIGNAYRPLDNSLWQVDLVFVKENGIFRQDHRYATEVQRMEQIKDFAMKKAQKLN